jgi:hypothetical protein
MDLTPEDIKALEAQSAKLANELNDILTVNRNISEEILKQTKNTRDLFGRNSQNYAVTFDLLKQNRNISATLTKQISLVNNIGKGITKEKELKKEIIKNETILNNLNTVRNQIQNDLAAQQDALKEKLEKQHKAELEYQAALALRNGRQVQQAKTALLLASKSVKSEQDKIDQLQKNIEVTDRLTQNFRESNDALKTGIVHVEQQNIKLKQIGQQIFKNIISAVTFGLTIRGLFQSFLELNKTVTETAQQLGISVEQTQKFIVGTSEVSSNFTSSIFSIRSLNKGLGELNTALGTSLLFSQQEVVQFTELTKTIGLNAEEATKLFTLSKLNKLTLKQTEQAIIAGTVASNNQYKVQISAKTVMQDISKLSAGILIKFKENPEALAKAVVQAKALGYSLEQIDKISDSLLNFESSIQSELEAELLTGKQLNFEKARYYALTNDSVGLMNELAQQTGGLVNYNKLNRLQQEAIAKSIGMSRDELSQTLIDQEKFSKLGNVAQESAAKQLEYAKAHGITLEQSVMKSLEQQAVQDRFNETMDKLKDILADIVSGPMGSFVKMLTKAVDSAGGLATIIGVFVVGGIAKIIRSLPALIEGFQALKSLKIGEAIASAWTVALASPESFLTGGIAGAILAGGLTAAIMSATKVGDFISDGQSIIHTPNEGTFVTSPRDQIVAAPGAADAVKGGGGISKEDLMNALSNRPIIVQSQLVAGSNVIQNWQTSAGQYSNSGRFA